MANFILSLNITLKHEGGYANLQGDTGGRTLFGISQNNHPSSVIWQELDKLEEQLSPFSKKKYAEINSLARDNKIIMKEVQNIYYEEYWKRIKGDLIVNQNSANVLFDMAVNAGVKRASKLAQELVKVAVDGIIGAKSIQAINDYGDNFCNDYTQKRIEWYSNRQDKTYLAGWINRANKFIIS